MSDTDQPALPPDIADLAARAAVLTEPQRGQVLAFWAAALRQAERPRPTPRPRLAPAPRAAWTSYR